MGDVQIIGVFHPVKPKLAAPEIMFGRHHVLEHERVDNVALVHVGDDDCTEFETIGGGER